MDKGNRKLPSEITGTPALTPELALPAPRWRSLSALITVIILLLVLLGVLLYIHFKYARLESALNKYENLWNEQGISGYNFELTAGDYWHTTIRVRAYNGIITSKTITEDGDITSMVMAEENIGLKQSDSDCNTVEKLFTTIRNTIEDREDTIKVTYNRSLGYPTYLLITSRGDTSGLYLRVSDFYIPDSNYLQRESELNGMESELNRNENVWNEQKILSYDYILTTRSTNLGYCKAVMQVRDDIPRSELIIEYDRGLDPLIHHYNTIPKLFDHIRDAIIDAMRDRADIIEVNYNPSLGYPIYLHVDSRGFEDQYGFSVSDFCILEGNQ